MSKKCGEELGQQWRTCSLLSSFFSSNSKKLLRMFELFSCAGRKGFLQVHLGNGLENVAPFPGNPGKITLSEVRKI